MINTLVIDLTETTRANIAKYQPDSADAVRAAPALAAFSPQLRAQADDLKRFLHANLYRHYRVLPMGQKAQRILRELFEACVQDPRFLAPEHRREDPPEPPRASSHYVAGMSDRPAVRAQR